VCKQEVTVCENDFHACNNEVTVCELGVTVCKVAVTVCEQEVTARKECFTVCKKEVAMRKLEPTAPLEHRTMPSESLLWTAGGVSAVFVIESGWAARKQSSINKPALPRLGETNR